MKSTPSTVKPARSRASSCSTPNGSQSTYTSSLPSGERGGSAGTSGSEDGPSCRCGVRSQLLSLLRDFPLPRARGGPLRRSSLWGADCGAAEAPMAKRVTRIDVTGDRDFIFPPMGHAIRCWNQGAHPHYAQAAGCSLKHLTEVVHRRPRAWVSEVLG